MRKILVACEYSGIVRDAFTRIGWDSRSCDILPTESEGHHYQGSIFDLFDDWSLIGWDSPPDMMIAHPPCTYLATSGIHWNKKRPERAELTDEAIEFVRKLMDADIPMIAIENPRSVISSRIRPANQLDHPYHFGEPISKGICLWLKGLPNLVPTNDVREEVMSKPLRERWPEFYLPPGPERQKARSKFFVSVADAMANQWGYLLHG